MLCTRRSLLAGMAATASVGLAAGPSFAASPKRFFQRDGRRIGLQLYTLGDEARRDFDGTLARVATIGYRDIELPELFGRSARDIRVAADAARVAISSLHLPMFSYGPGPGLSLTNSVNEIAETLGQLGADYAVVPLALIPDGFKPPQGQDVLAALAAAYGAAGEDPWKRTAAILNEKAAALKPFGISLGYHNHNIEFAPIGMTNGWEILWRECEPDLVSFEVDTGWVATAGLDTVAFIDRHRSRIRQLHVKDVAADNVTNFALTTKSVEIGAGTLDWAHILPAAAAAGVRHFYVELEPPFAAPPIDAVRRSHAFLAQLRA